MTNPTQAQGSAPSSRVDTARDAVSSAYASARDTTARVAQRASDTIADSPAPALLGGLALGLIVGALLPRTERETELFGSFGGRVGDAARAAFDAAREAGGAGLGDVRLDAGTARDHAAKLFGDVVRAASDAGLSSFRGAGAKA